MSKTLRSWKRRRSFRKRGKRSFLRSWRGLVLFVALAMLTGLLASPPMRETTLNTMRKLPGGEGVAELTNAHKKPLRSATVVRGRAQVIDGDSLRVNGVNIRLHGIDAPESRQTCWTRLGRRYACGQRETAHMRRLVAGRVITCRKVTTDRYGRMVAICKRGSEDIGRRMVRDGWAVAFVRYSRHYVADERMARTAHRGLWQGRFIEPALWRRMKHRRRYR